MLGFYVLCIEETPLPNFWSISRNKFGLSSSVDKFSGYLLYRINVQPQSQAKVLPFY